MGTCAAPVAALEVSISRQLLLHLIFLILLFTYFTLFRALLEWVRSHEVTASSSGREGWDRSVG